MREQFEHKQNAYCAFFNIQQFEALAQADSALSFLLHIQETVLKASFQLFERQLDKLSKQHLLPKKQVMFLQMGSTVMHRVKRLLEFKVR